MREVVVKIGEPQQGIRECSQDVVLADLGPSFTTIQKRKSGKISQTSGINSSVPFVGQFSIGGFEGEHRVFISNRY